MTLPVVILAGGEGRRMGGDKPLRRLDGRTLLEHALGAARAWSASLAVCVRRPGQIVSAAPVTLTDVPGVDGPLAGLAAALDWAAAQGCDRVLVIPCDMPRLPVDLAGRLAANLAPDRAVAVAASGGRLHPVCAVWRTCVRPLVDAQVREGRLSLTALAERAGLVAVEWPVGAFDPFVNLNTPDELAETEGRIRAAATG